MSELVVKAQGLTKVYKLFAEEIAAVNNIDLEIRAGEFVSIMGPSGSGKTTLLDLIGCLDGITAGRLEILGTDVSHLNESRLVKVRRGQIGFIFQDFSLIPTLTALENVQLASYFAGNGQAKDTLREALEKVGLGHRINHLPKQLSGGEKQRVAIARALVTRPKFLLADEPTGHLDTENSQQIVEVFKRLNEEEGLTIIIATHDARIGAQTGRVIYLQDGRIAS
ncbi:MAG TPA: ABC transporter ATP-binding protein [Anaerohalosphaeraceae bacterium]|jgi:putative ABC transport system ATP-binding protein|nr:ABC transporter ATP-binding protein [Anaerohalosphaeraceae bacterium]HRT49088.1 ABC transporter ATP-binding protein [Anaerohalosphaeraceae bacterium]HRT85659.1 ABC transporter ATP-binding protein [Anaerohalosphaeraceae bacterium]